MRKIRLNRGEWDFDESTPLAPAGGFGQVFAGAPGKAIKRLNVVASQAQRELSLAETLANQNFPNVVPVFDAGEDAESGGFFIVMARCDKSLQDHLKAARPTPAEAVSIMSELAEGFAQVGDIVHRDIKPPNILLHDGHWKIADFGIARFVEETTSLNTLKGCLSPPFAAPEQWRNERATKATDIYALGCVAYLMLTGRTPFQGTSLDDFQAMHLGQDPPGLPSEVLPGLRSLIMAMLRKPAEARPSLGRVKATLAKLGDTATPARWHSPALAELDAAISKKNLRDDAEREQQRIEHERMAGLARVGQSQLLSLRKDLFERISHQAQNAIRGPDFIELGFARLTLVVNQNRHDAVRLGLWTVVAAGYVEVAQNGPRLYKWSASLWFTDAGEPHGMRCFQLSFMVNPLTRRDRIPAAQPFMAYPWTDEAIQAFAPGMTAYQKAETPRPVDAEDFDDFCGEWIDRFALAAEGQLRYPQMLPLPRR
jgi:serine/threonine-protein kinase